MTEPTQASDVQAMQDDLAAHADYLKTVARATQKLSGAVEDLLASLPPETRDAIAKQLAAELEQQQPPAP